MGVFSRKGLAMGNHEETTGDRKVYPTERLAEARQRRLWAAGIGAGMIRQGQGWVLTHDPDDAFLPHRSSEKRTS